MRPRTLPLASLLALSLLAVGRDARGLAISLAFDDATCDGGQACGDSAAIDASYGDVSGLVDVVYDQDLGSAAEGPLIYWGSGYGSLAAVAFGAGIAGTQTAEIFLAPQGGASVALHGFDLGAWQSVARTTQVTILDGTGALLFSSGSIQVQDTTSLVFDLESTSGIRIQWGPTAYYVALDNLSFEVVPEPAAWALLALAAGALHLRSTLRRHGVQDARRPAR